MCVHVIFHHFLSRITGFGDQFLGRIFSTFIRFPLFVLSHNPHRTQQTPPIPTLTLPDAGFKLSNRFGLCINRILVRYPVNPSPASLYHNVGKKLYCEIGCCWCVCVRGWGWDGPRLGFCLFRHNLDPGGEWVEGGVASSGRYAIDKGLYTTRILAHVHNLGTCFVLTTKATGT